TCCGLEGRAPISNCRLSVMLMQRINRGTRWAGSVGICAILLLAVLAAVAPKQDVRAQEPSPSASETTRPELTEVFGLARSNDVDTLVLRDGTRFTGEALTEVLELRTVYGILQLPRQALAGIRFHGDDSQLDTVLAVNRNRMAGFVENPVIRMRLESGAELDVRREKVEIAIFRFRSDKAGANRIGWHILLRNGDVLTGKGAADATTLHAQGSNVSIPNDELAAIRFHDRTDGSAVFQKRNGEELNGVLESDDIEFHLDLGPRISIYKGYLKSVLDRDAFAVEEGFILQGRDLDYLENLELGKDAKLRGLVWIPPGRFLFGSSSEERDRGLDEGPQIDMQISEGFWMGKFEVTQGAYLAVMNSNPSHYTGDLNHPVEKVSWQEAVEYCARRTAKELEMGVLPSEYEYRLPTEAEWEYACRAGTVTRFSFGDDQEYARLAAFAWFNGNSNSSTHSVGLKKPNPWGLYDMHGNVWEWCLDYGREGDSARRSSSLRGARGGSWLYEGRFCRSSNRDAYFPTNRCSDLGFRIVLAPVPR
ncbi:MAG: formylglycine-generating enzyme family protein, partial [Verrucomicrobia bacterium]|nr:formylglycine-generating enzyme family protein [Verrucomicrobiota bacterium]